MTGIELIAKERQRQIENEGWTISHDDTHTDEQIAYAAACYATPPEGRKTWISGKLLSPWWPWSDLYWKPTPDNRIRELVKAGALIVAEIERLQRAGEAGIAEGAVGK